MRNHAVFLDRDNTINYDPGYLGDPDKVRLMEGVARGIKRLRDEYGFKIIVISNQSGIARKLITEEDVRSVNNRVNKLLRDEGAEIDAFYYCPYHPDFSPPEKCGCRKPSPLMVVKAAKDHNIDLKKSYFVGDMPSDIICGLDAGVKSSILLAFDKGSEKINQLKNEGKTPNFVAANFTEACRFIIEDFTGGN